MNNNTIAVTGVGGGVGQSVVKSLYDSGYKLVGLDGEALGTGLYAVPTAYKIPYANSGQFIPELLRICEAEGCGLLFPGLDAELLPLALNKHLFEAIGTRVVVSDESVIEISDNKLSTYEKLSVFGLNVPRTIDLDVCIASGEKPTFPVIVKQKVGGARSKNVFLIRTADAWDSFLETHGADAAQFIVQDYIEGPEYTCGTINFDGACKGVIVMRRILRDGDTYKCFVENRPEVESAVRKLVESIKPFGACNVQLRLRDGIPYIFEVNARCSGTTASRTACGFNEPKMIADYLLKGIEPSYKILEKTVLRYWQELVVDNEKVNLLSSAGTLKSEEYTRF